MKYKTKLTVMGSTRVDKNTSLRTGCAVPESGIYRVLHSLHVLPREVTLLREQVFPRCSRCDEPVYYELVRSAPALLNVHPTTFRVALYELPELSSDDKSVA